MNLPGLLQLSFSKPDGATSVVLMHSLDGTNWNPSPVVLDQTSQMVLAPVTLATTNYYKLVVTGGTRAGDSNVLQVQAM